MRLVVAITTFCRPCTLEPNLHEVVAQAASLRRDAGRPVEPRVVVIDNDPEASAADVAQRAGSMVHYVVEATPGIVAARNRALDEAATADLLVFIDDDEIPQPDWLAELFRTWSLHRPAAVWGRVTSRFEEPLAPWVAAGGFFVRRRHPTGTHVKVAASGNLLLDVARVRAHGLRFDGRMGLGGGEDTLFTRTLVAHGETIVWCDEAEAIDVVPPARVTRAWVLARAVSHGNVAARVEQQLAGTHLVRLSRRLRNVAGGLVRIGGGAAQHVFGWLTGSCRARARGLRAVCRGIGMVAGGLGFVYEEYARTGGWWAKWRWQ